MVGTSEGEARFFGYLQARFLVDAWKEETNLAIFLNADHHKSFESAKNAIDSGYDSVLIDGSSFTFEENINLTKDVLDYAKSKNKEISVEGELGYLPGKSEIQEFVRISIEDFTKPGEAKKFVEMTGVDRLAIAFGNIHGIATNQKISLDFDLLKEISQAIPDTYLVLHGGSGLDIDDFRKSINNGIRNIHINTEIRVAYRNGIEENLKENPKEIVPYKFLNKGIEKVKKAVEEKIKIFFGL